MEGAALREPFSLSIPHDNIRFGIFIGVITFYEQDSKMFSKNSFTDALKFRGKRFLWHVSLCFIKLNPLEIVTCQEHKLHVVGSFELYRVVEYVVLRNRIEDL